MCIRDRQYVERCSRRAVEYCVAVVQPGRDDATRDGLGKVEVEVKVTVYCATFTGEDLSRYLNKIESV